MPHQAQAVDGPAIGQTLHLKRTPIMLRWVVDAVGEWDALDQRGDAVYRDETPYCYIIDGEPSSMHVDRVVNGRRVGEWCNIVRYKQLLVDPPTRLQMVDEEAWAGWCTDNKDRLIGMWESSKKVGL